MVTGADGDACVVMTIGSATIIDEHCAVTVNHCESRRGAKVRVLSSLATIV